MPINNINGDIPMLLGVSPYNKSVNMNEDIPQKDRPSCRGVSPNLSSDNKALLKACQDFEEIFVHMLLKEMRSTIPEDGLTEKSTAREIFEDMYDQELAGTMSKNNGIGIAKMLYNQMKTK